VALEGVIGFEKRGQRLTFDPCVPSAWPEATVQYRYGSTQYMIVIRNPDGVCRGVRSVEVDGALRDDKWILLSDDGAAHSVIVTLGVGDVA
jgi:cyclic beta-1,2-glucan synthetase